MIRYDRPPLPPRPFNLAELAIGRLVETIHGDAIYCPHCVKKDSKYRKRTGWHTCKHCGESFWLRVVGRRSFVTCKEEIRNDFSSN